jgi:integrase
LTIYVTNIKFPSKRQSKYFRQEQGRFLFEKRLNSDKGWFPLFPNSKIFLKPLRVANASEAALEARRLKEEIENLQLVAARDSRKPNLSTPSEIFRAVKTWLWVTGVDEELATVKRSSELTEAGNDARIRLGETINAVTDAYRSEGGIGDYLSDFGAALFEALTIGSPPVLMSNALDVYIRSKGFKSSSKSDKAIADLRRWIGQFISVVNDRPIDKITRKDVEQFIDHRLKSAKTGTVRREMNALSAVWSCAARDNNITSPSPFTRHVIPDEGKDAKERISYTHQELIALYKSCKDRDDDIRWLTALIIDTGARMGEITGLALSDLVLDAEVPHVIFKDQPWRTLKTKGSIRNVPLVGASLWAASRIVETAKTSQFFAFPRYTTAIKCNASNASASVNQFIRSQGINHIAHELRHSIQDRLRNVDCPKDMRYAIDGHAHQDVGDTYGNGFSLIVLKRWLDKVALQ